MILTYKYKLKNSHRAKQLREYSYSVNQVWNYCNSIQRKAIQLYHLGEARKILTRFDFQKLTSNTSKELGIHAQSVQEVCYRYVQSRDKHKHKRLKFRKSTEANRNLGWIPFSQQSRQVTEDSITYLGYRYKLFGAKRRPLPINRARGGCFVEDSSGNWFVCIQVETEEDQVHGTGAVGIDLGLNTFATLSNGQKFDSFKPYRKYQEKLKVAQRANNKSRTRTIHQKIKNIRLDFNHKLSNLLVKQFNQIFVGNVSSAKLKKTRFSKSVSDVAWSQFRGMLRYKASRHGATFQEINEAFTTQTCSWCGNGATPERPKGIAGLGIREWRCSECGTNHDRDINSAKNILSLGLSAQPLVEGS